MQRFIVVDDSRAIQAIISRAIKAGGYGQDSIHSVSSGMEALDLVDSVRPDLVITDWHMPGISGLELLQTLRQMGYRSIKVGLVTTEMSEARLEEARNNGVEFILHKPFKDADLLAAIEKAVGLPSASDAPPPEPDAPVPEQDVIASVDAVAFVLKATLPTAAFTLVKADAIQFDHSSPKVLVGLYSKTEQKSVDALCIMDMACAGLIGSAILGYNVVQMQTALSTEAGRETITGPVSAFLGNLAALFPSVDNKPHKLARSNVLGFDIAPLKKALQRNAGMQVYELQVKNHGRGRFALLKLNA